MDFGDGGLNIVIYILEGFVRMGKLRIKMIIIKINIKEHMKGFLKGKKDWIFFLLKSCSRYLEIVIDI